MTETISKKDFDCYGILDCSTLTFIGVGVTIEGAKEDARIFIQEHVQDGRDYWPTKTVKITVNLLETVLLEGYSFSKISFSEDYCFADVR